MEILRRLQKVKNQTSPRWQVGLAAGFLFLLILFFLSPPAAFPTGSIITVSPGTSLQTLSLKLHEDKVVRSPFWFRFFSITLGGERDMKAGDYYLSSPKNSFTVAWKMLHGDYDLGISRVTIPEGYTVAKISALFDEKFPLFDREDFELKAKEGYLFPDTYYIPLSATADSAIEIMNDNFIKKVSPLMSEIEESGKTLEEVIIMASILEGETRAEEDMRSVSGILWKRLNIDMPLQVDASFSYVNGKNTYQLTLEDLKTESAYNTYLYKGLPPGPISNPGLTSIKAAIYPEINPYLYFLTGDDGKMHYSKTFEEHVANKNQHIREY